MAISRRLSRSLQHLPIEDTTEYSIGVDHFHSPERQDDHLQERIPTSFYPAQKFDTGIGEEGTNGTKTGRGRGRVEQARGQPECALCLNQFQDTGESVPRNLVCGHTYCTS